MQKFSKFLNNIYPILLLLIFILAIYLRTKVYLTNQSFWHDECALAWNIINKSYIDLLQPLRFLQAAPILFLFITKFFVNTFGNNELVFRFFPYITGILSLPAFYILSKMTLNNKLTIFFANIIFAVCLPLYYYAGEFKPYSSDVLFCILSTLVFIRLNKSNFLLCSILLSSFIWFSFPAVFITAAVIILVLISKKYNIKEKILFLLPHLVNIFIYNFLFFSKMFSTQKLGMTNYWQNSFINIDNFTHLIRESFNFMFLENSILPVLAVFGLFVLIKENNKIWEFASLLLLIVIFASSLKLYPYSSRLILFLGPVYIILITKVLDTKNKIVSLLFALALMIGLYPQAKYTSQTIISDKYNKNNTNPREMAEYLAKHINKDDVIYINTDSNSDYLYYKQINNISNKYIIENTNELAKNSSNIWFFLVNNPMKTYENTIKRRYKIINENKTEHSMLIYAKKL